MERRFQRGMRPAPGPESVLLWEAAGGQTGAGPGGSQLAAHLLAGTVAVAAGGSAGGGHGHNSLFLAQGSRHQWLSLGMSRKSMEKPFLGWEVQHPLQLRAR